MKGWAGMAIFHEDKQKKNIQGKLSNKCSIYIAEALAILKVIEYIISEINHDYITIHSDSLSTVTSLLNLHNPIDSRRKIQNAHYRAQLSSKNIFQS